MEEIIKTLDDIKAVTTKLDEVEEMFKETKKKYLDLNQKTSELYAERKKLLDELLHLCE